MEVGTRSTFDLERAEATRKGAVQRAAQFQGAGCYSEVAVGVRPALAQPAAGVQLQRVTSRRIHLQSRLEAFGKNEPMIRGDHEIRHAGCREIADTTAELFQHIVHVDSGLVVFAAVFTDAVDLLRGHHQQLGGGEFLFFLRGEADDFPQFQHQRTVAGFRLNPCHARCPVGDPFTADADVHLASLLFHGKSIFRTRHQGGHAHWSDAWELAERWPQVDGEITSQSFQQFRSHLIAKGVHEKVGSSPSVGQ